MHRFFSSLMIASVMGLGTNSHTARAAGLEEGRPIPDLKFTNVQGIEVDSADYSDWVQVYTFADRHSSDGLMNWMNEAALEAMSRYPEARFAYFGFADVTTVPEMVRNLATTAIAEVDKRSHKKLMETYAQRGLVLDPERAVFHLTPDWEGLWLQTFKIDSAQVFYCWIVYQGRVVARYQGDSPGLTERYLADLDRLFSE